MGEEINKSLPSTPTQPTNSRISEEYNVEMSLLSDDPLSMTEEAPSLVIENQQTGIDADAGMAGVYLGIHNIFATVPQFLATFVSMVVFSILEPGQSPELAASDDKLPSFADDTAETLGTSAKSGLSGTAICLAIGAVFQLVAAAQSFRMRRY